jgi:hypothetical protein
MSVSRNMGAGKGFLLVSYIETSEVCQSSEVFACENVSRLG